MAELLGTPAVGMPGAVNRITFAQKHIDAEAGVGRRVDIGRERAVRRRVPVHLVADPVPVGQRLPDRSRRDDDEARVVVVQEVQAGELRREAGTAGTLPLGAIAPHVVVDDELRAPAEDIGKADRTVRADQRVVGHLHHRQSPTRSGDRVQLAGGGFLSLPQLVEFVAPGLGVHHGRQGGRVGHYCDPPEGWLAWYGIDRAGDDYSSLKR